MLSSWRATGSGDDALTLRGVGVSFRGLVALADVDLELRPSEIVGLIGPNGAGKTTLLNAVTGYARPDTGEVLVGGRNVTGSAPHRLARMGVARTFQSVRVFPRLTVEENVVVGALAVGESRRRAAATAADALAEFGLYDKRGVRAGSLPYGEERRLSLARALATRPRFLLLDEPAAGLNEVETSQLTQELATLPEKFGCGLLVVEHDMRLIMRLCSRLHVLAHGRTIAAGSPHEVRNSEEVVRSYLGHQAVNHA